MTKWVYEGLVTVQKIAVMSWIQVRNAYWEPMDDENETAIKHFANMWGRKRECLLEWWDPCVEKVNFGVAVAEDEASFNGMCSYTLVETHFNIIATIYFAHEVWLFVNSGFTAWKHTPTSAHKTVTSVVTGKHGLYLYQPDNCWMTVLHSSMIVFYFRMFLNCIMTHFFTLPMMIPEIPKLKATIGSLIQSNLQFQHVSKVLHTWTTI